MSQTLDNLKEKNEETYEELISLIENTQGRLALIIVACDDLTLQNRIIERYETEARQVKIRPYRIMLGQEPSVRAGLAALKAQNDYLQTGGEAVFTVTGTELLLRVKLNPQDEQSDLDKFFGYLQWTREGLREFRYPIALWVSYRILKEMSRRAPDFWSWRKAVLRFVNESEPLFTTVVPSEPLSRSLEKDDEFLLPISELQAEIAQSEARDPQSVGLATLYQKLGQVYARRIRQGEAENLEEEREKAIVAFHQAIALFRSQNNLSAQLSTLKQLGDFLDSQSRYVEATACDQQSLKISREIGDRGGEASALNDLGNGHEFLGDYQRAIEFLQQSLEIYREIGNRQGKSKSLDNLGATYKSLGEYQKATEFHQQSLEIRREIGDRRGEAISLGNLGNVYKLLGQYERAIELYQQYCEIARGIGDRESEAIALGNFGGVYQLLGEYRRAIEFHQKSLEIHREIGDRRGEAISLNNMAFALAKLDRRWEALQNYKQAQQIYEDLKLDHRVEQCKTAIYNLQQIISPEPIRAPQIRNESASPKPRKRQRFPWWGWVLVGVAIVLLIAWCLR